MAKQPRETRPETAVPTKQAEQAPHPLGLDGDKPTEITDEDYWAREEEYHDVFAVYDTMHEIAHSVGVSWHVIGNHAVDQVQSHAMTQPHDEAMEEALRIAGKNCASLMHMLAAHGKQVVFREVDGNAEFYLLDSRTGVEELVWNEEERQPQTAHKIACSSPNRPGLAR